MATIKPIEGSSVHQIQSGQVIVDLCSVVKELVENALDASATSLEIRFKNNGIDSIEVSDNGAGIAPEDFDSIALKHHTSKLSKYDDLTSLATFGFRGEALSSLCALSKLHIVTSRAGDAPKGTKLEFETSGRLKGKSVVASQRGTTVTVEDIFRNLPVRRRELEKNIKREYGKVLGLLHAYACISTGVRFSVSNVPAKGKKVVVFSTKSNPTTRENIANVYGAKTLLALIPLDLQLELHPTATSAKIARNWASQGRSETKEVRLKGHISRPVVGEGRQTPDRQMFFVNSRPCALPQVSKAINEVYKSYNVTQSPFIFANLELDTNAYDVNVSPDKRTILLHDQSALLEALKTSLVELFESQDQSVPHATTPSIKKLPLFKPPTVNTAPSAAAEEAEQVENKSSSQTDGDEVPQTNIVSRVVEGDMQTRDNAMKGTLAALAAKKRRETEKTARDAADAVAPQDRGLTATDEVTEDNRAEGGETQEGLPWLPRPVQDFNARMGVELPTQSREKLSVTLLESDGEEEAEELGRRSPAATPEDRIPSVSNTPQKAASSVVLNAFDRMRPRRVSQDVATVTIGNQTTRMTMGIPEAKKRRIHIPKIVMSDKIHPQSAPGFTSSIKAFAAPGAKYDDGDDDGDEDDEDDEHEALAQDRPIASGAVKRRPAATTNSLASSLAATTTTMDSDMLDIADEPAQTSTTRAPFPAYEGGLDDEYLDEAEKKAREEARIAKMIEVAEELAARPTSDNLKRAANVLKGRTRKDSTLQLMQCLGTSVEGVERSLKQLTKAMDNYASGKQELNETRNHEDETESAEERLSLTVSKVDFSRMRIIGQFNLGFILATRAGSSVSSSTQAVKPDAAKDELFIIDQHASDEKYNFERLQSQTIVQNQRLVHPKQLELTAIEEEIILNHPDALSKNGFEIALDTSGTTPVGQRCKLISLPMSREVTFSISDLEELLALLSEYPESSADAPRPSKVRRMFAMRACRSSIMVGMTLTRRQMEEVVRHMGKLDKPWNCPHGRPTMRHLFSLEGFEPWSEGEGLVGMQEFKEEKEVEWGEYMRRGRQMGLLDDEDDDEGDEEFGQEEGEDPAERLFMQNPQKA